MEERRLLLALALSFLVLTAWRYFMTPPALPEAAGNPSPTASASPTPPAAASGATPAPTPQPSASPVAPRAAVARVADERERRVEIEGPDVSVAFTNRGARLISWRLKRFEDSHGEREEMVQALREGPRPLDI